MDKDGRSKDVGEHRACTTNRSDPRAGRHEGSTSPEARSSSPSIWPTSTRRRVTIPEGHSTLPRSPATNSTPLHQPIAALPHSRRKTGGNLDVPRLAPHSKGETHCLRRGSRGVSSEPIPGPRPRVERDERQSQSAKGTDPQSHRPSDTAFPARQRISLAPMRIGHTSVRVPIRPLGSEADAGADILLLPHLKDLPKGESVAFAEPRGLCVSRYPEGTPRPGGD